MALSCWHTTTDPNGIHKSCEQGTGKTFRNDGPVVIMPIGDELYESTSPKSCSITGQGQMKVRLTTKFVSIWKNGDRIFFEEWE